MLGGCLSNNYIKAIKPYLDVYPPLFSSGTATLLFSRPFTPPIFYLRTRPNYLRYD